VEAGDRDCWRSFFDHCWFAEKRRLRSHFSASAAVSVSANIAEGYGRTGKKDKKKFYDYARGSAYETKSLLIYGATVKYFSQSQVDVICERLETVIHSLNKIKLSIQG